eukprot:6210434-Pleurochrysis_carterae.AAC.1
MLRLHYLGLSLSACFICAPHSKRQACNFHARGMHASFTLTKCPLVRDRHAPAGGVGAALREGRARTSLFTQLQGARARTLANTPKRRGHVAVTRSPSVPRSLPTLLPRSRSCSCIRFRS